MSPNFCEVSFNLDDKRFGWHVNFKPHFQGILNHIKHTRLASQIRSGAAPPHVIIVICAFEVAVLALITDHDPCHPIHATDKSNIVKIQSPLVQAVLHSKGIHLGTFIINNKLITSQLHYAVINRLAVGTCQSDLLLDSDESGHCHSVDNTNGQLHSESWLIANCKWLNTARGI